MYKYSPGRPVIRNERKPNCAASLSNIQIDLSSADYKTISHNAWITLVAPHYSSLSNFVSLTGTSDYEKPHFVSANATGSKTGKKVYVG